MPQSNRGPEPTPSTQVAAPRDHLPPARRRVRLAVATPRFDSLAGHLHADALDALGYLLPDLEQLPTTTSSHAGEAGRAGAAPQEVAHVVAGTQPAAAAVAPSTSKPARQASGSATLPPRTEAA